MPLSPSELTITDNVLRSYHEKGYWVSPVLFDEAEVAMIHREVTRICNGERDFDGYPWLGTRSFADDDPAMRQVNNGWWINRIMRDVVKTPVIGYIGATLMNTNAARIWHDQMLLKPGLGPAGATETAGNIGWHQDYAHWQCANTNNFCTAWVALQDTNLSNGGMRTIVGSHKWGLTNDAHTFGEKDLEGLEKQFRREDTAWIDEPCILKAGQASFHHALTFHGSGPNLSTEPRLSFVVHMMPADCGFTGQGLYHPNADLLGPFVEEGTLFAGPFFPQIWPVTEA